MKLKKLIVSGIALTVAIAFVDAGTLKGHVKFDGKAPKSKRLKMNADPVCGASHSGPVYSESFKMAADGSMAEAIVYLKNVSYSGGSPADPVVLDQNGCIYNPHVFGMVAGQELLIKNSDATLHNIHSRPNVNKEFNFAMPKVVKEKKSTFAESEPEPFYIKCDVHPWMGAFIGVFDHPYFAVTGDDGSYVISGLEPGVYVIEAWHEKLGSQTANVTVGDSAANFTFKKPEKTKKK